MSTDAFEQLIDVAAPGGGSYPVQRGHRRGVRSPHTFDAARWPPSSLTSPYAPQGSTTAVLTVLADGRAVDGDHPSDHLGPCRPDLRGLVSHHVGQTRQAGPALADHGFE